MAKKRIDVDAVISQIRLQERAGDPAVPSAGFTWLYTKALGLYLEQDDGTVLGPFGAGGGGGAERIILLPKANEPPSANYATLDTRNNHPILDFDEDTDESSIYSNIFLEDYDGGGLTVNIHWSADGVTANNVVWNAAIERIGDEILDVDGDSFAAVQAVTDAAPGTDGFVTVATITFTDGAQMDNLAAGELFRIKITRDADNGSDTMLADAQLHAVVLLET